MEQVSDENDELNRNYIKKLTLRNILKKSSGSNANQTENSKEIGTTVIVNHDDDEKDYGDDSDINKTIKQHKPSIQKRESKRLDNAGEDEWNEPTFMVITRKKWTRRPRTKASGTTTPLPFSASQVHAEFGSSNTPSTTEKQSEAPTQTETQPLQHQHQQQTTVSGFEQKADTTAGFHYAGAFHDLDSMSMNHERTTEQRTTSGGQYVGVFHDLDSISLNLEQTTEQRTTSGGQYVGVFHDLDSMSLNLEQTTEQRTTSGGQYVGVFHDLDSISLNLEQTTEQRTTSGSQYVGVFHDLDSMSINSEQTTTPGTQYVGVFHDMDSMSVNTEQTTGANANESQYRKMLDSGIFHNIGIENNTQLMSILNEASTIFNHAATVSVDEKALKEELYEQTRIPGMNDVEKEVVTTVRTTETETESENTELMKIVSSADKIFQTATAFSETSESTEKTKQAEYKLLPELNEETTKLETTTVDPEKTAEDVQIMGMLTEATKLFENATSFVDASKSKEIALQFNSPIKTTTDNPYESENATVISLMSEASEVFKQATSVPTIEETEQWILQTNVKEPSEPPSTTYSSRHETTEEDPVKVEINKILHAASTIYNLGTLGTESTEETVPPKHMHENQFNPQSNDVGIKGRATREQATETEHSEMFKILNAASEIIEQVTSTVETTNGEEHVEQVQETKMQPESFGIHMDETTTENTENQFEISSILNKASDALAFLTSSSDYSEAENGEEVQQPKILPELIEKESDENTADENTESQSEINSILNGASDALAFLTSTSITNSETEGIKQAQETKYMPEIPQTETEQTTANVTDSQLDMNSALNEASEALELLESSNSYSEETTTEERSTEFELKEENAITETTEITTENDEVFTIMKQASSVFDEATMSVTNDTEETETTNEGVGLAAVDKYTAMAKNISISTLSSDNNEQSSEGSGKTTEFTGNLDLDASEQPVTGSLGIEIAKAMNETNLTMQTDHKEESTEQTTLAHLQETVSENESIQNLLKEATKILEMATETVVVNLLSDTSQFTSSIHVIQELNNVTVNELPTQESSKAHEHITNIQTTLSPLETTETKSEAATVMIKEFTTILNGHSATTSSLVSEERTNSPSTEETTGVISTAIPGSNEENKSTSVTSAKEESSSIIGTPLTQTVTELQTITAESVSSEKSSENAAEQTLQTKITPKETTLQETSITTQSETNETGESTVQTSELSSHSDSTTQVEAEHTSHTEIVTNESTLQETTIAGSAQSEITETPKSTVETSELSSHSDSTTQAEAEHTSHTETVTSESTLQETSTTGTTQSETTVTGESTVQTSELSSHSDNTAEAEHTSHAEIVSNEATLTETSVTVHTEATGTGELTVQSSESSSHGGNTVEVEHISQTEIVTNETTLAETITTHGEETQSTLFSQSTESPSISSNTEETASQVSEQLTKSSEEMSTISSNEMSSNTEMTSTENVTEETTHTTTSNEPTSQGTSIHSETNGASQATIQSSELLVHNNVTTESESTVSHISHQYDTQSMSEHSELLQSTEPETAEVNNTSLITESISTNNLQGSEIITTEVVTKISTGYPKNENLEKGEETSEHEGVGETKIYDETAEPKNQENENLEDISTRNSKFHQNELYSTTQVPTSLNSVEGVTDMSGHVKNQTEPKDLQSVTEETKRPPDENLNDTMEPPTDSLTSVSVTKNVSSNSAIPETQTYVAETSSVSEAKTSLSEGLVTDITSTFNKLSESTQTTITTVTTETATTESSTHSTNEKITSITEVETTQQTLSSSLQTSQPPREKHSTYPFTEHQFHKIVASETAKKTTVLEEEGISEQLEHFSHHETSTICEMCDERKESSMSHISLPHGTEANINGNKHKQTVASIEKKPLPHEEVVGENEEHFSHHETSTICEICEETAKDNSHRSETGTSSAIHKKQTIKQTATHKGIPHEEFNTENLEEFSHHETSTLCELCNETITTGTTPQHVTENIATTEFKQSTPKILTVKTQEEVINTKKSSHVTETIESTTTEKETSSRTSPTQSVEEYTTTENIITTISTTEFVQSTQKLQETEKEEKNTRVEETFSTITSTNVEETLEAEHKFSEETSQHSAQTELSAERETTPSLSTEERNTPETTTSSSSTVETTEEYTNAEKTSETEQKISETPLQHSVEAEVSAEIETTYEATPTLSTEEHNARETISSSSSSAATSIHAFSGEFFKHTFSTTHKITEEPHEIYQADNADNVKDHNIITPCENCNVTEPATERSEENTTEGTRETVSETLMHSTTIEYTESQSSLQTENYEETLKTSKEHSTLGTTEVGTVSTTEKLNEEHIDTTEESQSTAETTSRLDLQNEQTLSSTHNEPEIEQNLSTTSEKIPQLSVATVEMLSTENDNNEEPTSKSTNLQTTDKAMEEVNLLLQTLSNELVPPSVFHTNPNGSYSVTGTGLEETMSSEEFQLATEDILKPIENLLAIFSTNATEMSIDTSLPEFSGVSNLPPMSDLGNNESTWNKNPATEDNISAQYGAVENDKQESNQLKLEFSSMKSPNSTLEETENSETLTSLLNGLSSEELLTPEHHHSTMEFLSIATSEGESSFSFISSAETNENTETSLDSIDGLTTIEKEAEQHLTTTEFLSNVYSSKESSQAIESDVGTTNLPNTEQIEHSKSGFTSTTELSSSEESNSPTSTKIASGNRMEHTTQQILPEQTGQSIQQKHTFETTNHHGAPSEQFGEEGVEHFSHHETSTICELCENQTKTSVTVGHNKEVTVGKTTLTATPTESSHFEIDTTHLSHEEASQGLSTSSEAFETKNKVTTEIHIKSGEHTNTPANMFQSIENVLFALTTNGTDAENETFTTLTVEKATSTTAGLSTLIATTENESRTEEVTASSINLLETSTETNEHTSEHASTPGNLFHSIENVLFALTTNVTELENESTSSITVEKLSTEQGTSSITSESIETVETVSTETHGSETPIISSSEEETKTTLQISESTESSGVGFSNAESVTSTTETQTEAASELSSQASQSGSNSNENVTSSLGTDNNSNVTLTSSTEIYIDLPIYLQNSTETPESFIKYYTTESKATKMIDDEATDVTVGSESFRSMSFHDFDVVTEFAPTTESFNLTVCHVIAVNVPHTGKPSTEQLQTGSVSVEESSSGTEEVSSLKSSQSAHEETSSTNEELALSKETIPEKLETGLSTNEQRQSSSETNEEVAITVSTEVSSEKMEIVSSILESTQSSHEQEASTSEKSEEVTSSAETTSENLETVSSTLESHQSTNEQKQSSRSTHEELPSSVSTEVSSEKQEVIETTSGSTSHPEITEALLSSQHSVNTQAEDENVTKKPNKITTMENEHQTSKGTELLQITESTGTGYSKSNPVASTTQSEQGRTSALQEFASITEGNVTSSAEIEKTEESTYSTEGLVLSEVVPNILKEFSTHTATEENAATTSSAVHNGSTSGSEPPHAISSTSTVPKELQNDYMANQCNGDDFNRRNACVCSVDGVLNDLKTIINTKELEEKLDTFSCPSFIKIKQGLVLENETAQEARTKRSYEFVRRRRLLKREAIQNSQIENVLNEEPDIQSTDFKIYATPGEKVTIPCISNQVTENEQSTKYSWSSTGGRSLSDAILQKTEGSLTIDNITPQDGGNYTCTVTSSTSEGNKNIEHQLLVISMPAYTVQVHILYGLHQRCELTDVDLTALYMPSNLKGLLCGFESKICSIQIHQPHCVSKGEKDYVSVLMTVAVEQLNVIFPSINSTICDIVCQMRLYGKITGIVVKNVETADKLPVISRMNFKKTVLTPTEEVSKKPKNEKDYTEPPQLVITCPPGFGLMKHDKICLACTKNTFSPSNESHCKPCPIGQFQPVVGSKSCLTCSSPLQDPACLRVMYSNTKMFRVYTGVGFAALVLIILLIVFCTTMQKNKKQQSVDKYRKYYSQGTEKVDVEQQATEPLLHQQEGPRRHRRQSFRTPPQPPPPDFLDYRNTK